MTNNGTILADSIAPFVHLQAFDLLVKQRFSELELDKLLVYIIDSVDSSAIPYLAAQFDVLGYKGFRLAQNEDEQRAIIKKSIELHRYKGTLWAVEQALDSIGYSDAIIDEHVDGHWANFRVTITVGTHPINALEISDLVNMITEYKNTRSHLVDITYGLAFTDSLGTTDLYWDGQAYTDVDTVTAGGDFRHNGLVLRNGSRNYSRDTDVLTIQIIPV